MRTVAYIAVVTGIESYPSYGSKIVRLTINAKVTGLDDEHPLRDARVTFPMELGVPVPQVGDEVHVVLSDPRDLGDLQTEPDEDRDFAQFEAEAAAEPDPDEYVEDTLLEERGAL